MGSLGEPFASQDFLRHAGWLTRQRTIRYVELVSNASLLKGRLPRMETFTNLGKLSLWLTLHEGQISLEKFIANAVFAQEEYGCSVVVNFLCFSADLAAVERVRAAAEEAGLRFNIDLGYDPAAPSHAFASNADLGRAVPVLQGCGRPAGHGGDLGRAGRH